VRKLESRAYVNNPQSFQEMKESIPRETAYLQDKTTFFKINEACFETLLRKNGLETPRPRGLPNVTELP